jgi:8-oxo-dGTP pyrophosphatase MutT (NUDIX family)
MPALRHKVFAYITHGDRLLVFRHPHAPAAGIQVPAGTVAPGEPFDQAVLREAWEETGLPDLILVRPLGEQQRDMRDYGRDEIHHRHFYHLVCGGDPPATWQHWERDPADGGEPPLFEFFWARLPGEVPALIADHGARLPDLCAALGLKEAG